MSDVSYEEFKKRLEKRSLKDLRSLSRGEGLKIPHGINSVSEMLQAMWDANAVKLSGTSAEVSPPSSPSASADVPRIRVLLRVGHSFWFDGRHYVPKWTEFPVTEFSASEMEAIRKHPRLIVRDVK